MNITYWSYSVYGYFYKYNIDSEDPMVVGVTPDTIIIQELKTTQEEGYEYHDDVSYYRNFEALKANVIKNYQESIDFFNDQINKVNLLKEDSYSSFTK